MDAQIGGSSKWFFYIGLAVLTLVTAWSKTTSQRTVSAMVGLGSMMFMETTCAGGCWTLRLRKPPDAQGRGATFWRSRLDLPGAVAENRRGIAVVSDPVHVERSASDHEVDVNLALVDPLLVRALGHG